MATGLITLPMAARGARSPRARATLAVAIMCVATLLLAWVSAQFSPGWALRYLAVLLGPLLLLGATGLARAGAQGAFVLLLLVIFWADPRMNALNNKSNAHDAAVAVADRLEPGDLVVATHPEQLPVMHVYLPDRLRWATAMGPVADPQIMDWRDVVARLEPARPTPTSDAMVRSLKSGQKLLLVQPIIRTAKWGAPWTSLVRRRPPSGSACSTRTRACRARWPAPSCAASACRAACGPCCTSGTEVVLPVALVVGANGRIEGRWTSGAGGGFAVRGRLATVCGVSRPRTTVLLALGR